MLIAGWPDEPMPSNVLRLFVLVHEGKKYRLKRS